MNHCKKESKCSHCGEMIKVGEPMVVGKAPMKHEGWTATLRWHPQCWISQGLAYLERNPYVAGRKGRKPLQLDEETKANRFRIQRQRASAMQKLNAVISRGVADSKAIDKIVRLKERLDRLKVEIEAYGGVPKKW